MDKAQALQLYQKSCGAENPVGCRYLGMHYEKGIGVAADKAQAVEAYRKGCDGEDKDSCDALKRLQP
jgi:TPR repeat protein